MFRKMGPLSTLVWLAQILMLVWLAQTLVPAKLRLCGGTAWHLHTSSEGLVPTRLTYIVSSEHVKLGYHIDDIYRLVRLGDRVQNLSGFTDNGFNKPIRFYISSWKGLRARIQKETCFWERQPTRI